MKIIDCARIGHMGFQIPLYFAKLKENPANTVDLFSFSSKTCNVQLPKMGRRVLTIYSWVKHLYDWNQFLPGGDVHNQPIIYSQEDKDGLFVKHNQKIPFLPEETNEAKNWLRKQGWSDGEPFVCLLVRDSAYLANDPLHGKGDRGSYLRWQYHDHRDADITTFYPAMKWLADQGVWVLRMGKIMAKQIPSLHPRIIDYAFHSEKSDLLDIWLFANCTGCISSSGGIDVISKVYGIPTISINAVPARHPLYSYNLIYVPKYQRWPKNHKNHTIKEIILPPDGIEIGNTKKIESFGVELIDLSPDEVLEAVKEFWGRIQGTWIESKEDRILQERFWELFLDYNDKAPDGHFHGWKHPDARIGSAWLLSQEKDFFTLMST